MVQRVKWPGVLALAYVRVIVPSSSEAMPLRCPAELIGVGGDSEKNGLMMQSERLTHRQKTTGLPGGPAISALAPPGSPTPFAIALLTSTLPYPHLRATTQSPTATLP
jgi:hypothetical protein